MSLRYTEVEVSMLKIEGIVEDIAAGELALPEFQRDFDWNDNDIRALLATLLKGWPAGNLLVMRGKPEWFGIRPFDGAPAVRAPRLVVLDGQQRLTSVYRAIGDVGPYVYAFKWAGAQNGDIDSIQDSVVRFPRARWDKTLRSVEQHSALGYVPFYQLRSPSDFFSWRDSVLSLYSGAAAAELGARLSDLYRSVLTRLNAYEFPAVVLERVLEPAAIARIFERINKQGLRLGPFDLVVARAYQSNWNLRTEWQGARERCPRLARFLEDDGMPILQLLALVTNNDVRESAVLTLPPDVVRSRWHAAANAVDAALGFFEACCGVWDPSLLPFRSMIAPVAALVLDGTDLSARRDVIENWFWDRSFNNHFDEGSNSRIVDDRAALQAAVAEGASLKSVGKPSRRMIRDATRRNNAAVWRAFACALASRRPTDLSGRELTPDVVERHSILAARALVDEDGAPWRPRAASLIMMSKPDAAMVRASSFGTFVGPLIASPEGRERVRQALELQFVPGPDALLDATNEPGAFVELRLDGLASYLAQRTGGLVVLAADGTTTPS
jgi:hypothetical protein